MKKNYNYIYWVNDHLALSTVLAFFIFNFLVELCVFFIISISTFQPDLNFFTIPELVYKFLFVPIYFYITLKTILFLFNKNHDYLFFKIFLIIFLYLFIYPYIYHVFLKYVLERSFLTYIEYLVESFVSLQVMNSSMFLIFIFFYFILGRLIKKKYRIANFVEVTGDKSKSNKQNEKYFSVNALNQNIVVKENEIMRVESSGNYVHLHTTEHFFPMRQTLTTLLKELSGNFIQIKRGVVVNLKYVLDLNNNEMVLINEDRYTVSEKYIDELNLAWKNYA
ncbi:hypothetical protein PAMA111031_04580 [Paraphotobacterium marinum]